MSIKYRERKQGKVDLEGIKEMDRMPDNLIFFTMDEQTTKRGKLKISPTFIKESRAMFGHLLLGNSELVETIKRK